MRASKNIFFVLQKSLFLIFLFTLLTLGFADRVHAQFIELTPGQDAQEIYKNIQYSKDFSGDIKDLALNKAITNLEKLETSTIHFGPTNTPVLVIIPVTNTSETEAAWILTTGRGALKNVILFEIMKNGTKTLLSSSDKEKFKQNLRDFQAISWEVVLKGKEQRSYGLLFESENSTYLPLKIQTYSNFFKA